MADNIAAGHGLHASSRVLSALIEAACPRPEAYEIVQRLALRAADEGASFRALVEADPAVTAALSAQTLERCFDDRAALRHVDKVIARLGRSDCALARKARPMRPADPTPAPGLRPIRPPERSPAAALSSPSPTSAASSSSPAGSSSAASSWSPREARRAPSARPAWR